MRIPHIFLILLAVVLFSCDRDSIQPGPEGRYVGTTDQGEPVSFSLEKIGDELFVTRYSITIYYDGGGGNAETEVISDANVAGLGKMESKAFTLYQGGDQSYPIQGFQEGGNMISGTYILRALLIQDTQPQVVSGTFRVNKTVQD